MNRARTAHPTALLISATVVYHVLDGVRSLYLYGRFGPGALDSFYGAYAVLEAAINALMFTALAAVLMPALAGAAQEGGERLAERLGSSVVAVALAVLAPVSAAGVVFAPQILLLYGFGQTPQSILIARLVFAVLPFFAMDKILRLLLEHRRQFEPPVAASLIVRVVFLGVVFASASAWGVASTGIGSLAAAVVTAGFLVAAFFAAGARMRRPLPLGHALLRRTGLLLLPLGIAGMFAQAPFVDGIFASYFGTGHLSLLRLGVTVYNVPLALFCISVCTAVFPRMCAAAAEGDRRALQGHIATGLRRALYFTLPTMFGLIVLARPLIRVAYERGQFNEHHTPLAAACLVAYALGLAAAGMRPILVRAVFAVNQYKWFIAVESVTLALNVAFNVLFAIVFGWGIVGLALSTAVVSFITTALLWLLVARLVGVGAMGGLRRALLEMGACAAGMGAVCHGVWRLTTPAADPGAVLVGVRLCAVIVLGAVLYFAGTAALRLEEFGDFRAILSKLVRRRRDK